jgi:hypothetical protein
LLRADGAHKYSDDEHRERVSSIVRDLDHELESAMASVDEARTKAQAELERIDATDPVDLLSVADLELVNARAPWVNRDIASAPMADVVKRAQAALSDGDKASAFLWLRAASDRLDTEHREGRASVENIQLSEVIAGLKAKLAGPADTRRADAKATIKAATELEFYAGRLREEATGINRAREEAAASPKYSQL